MRGNHDGRRECLALIGSIPACAGEPEIIDSQSPRGKVYPRACGGTSLRALPNLSKAGLSPRVRGNRIERERSNRKAGSIPARAGEPAMISTARVVSRVYPRACGGTLDLLDVVADGKGLSPRVRGNRRAGRQLSVFHRSIPARAGEPRGWRGSSGRHGVYPRACGGTGKRAHGLAPVMGLSPRVRGNLNPDRHIALDLGSIPARAGEPLPASGSWRGAWVYPRACGGTFSHNARIAPSMGLSPRVRGNPAEHFRSSAEPGSIPARAGKPLHLPGARASA